MSSLWRIANTMASHETRTRRWVTHALAAKAVKRIANTLYPTHRVVPVKGCLLARRFYDDPTDRPVSDCDLVVLGISSHALSRKLTTAGWRVADWSNDSNVVDMSHPEIPGIRADLHTRPLPLGYGAVSAAWLAEGSREDTTLFGAPVLIPDDRKLLVHLLGNILRDHITHARPHTSVDVINVIAKSPFSVSDFAHTIRDARLRLGCWAALEHVAATTREVRATSLQEALELTATERNYALWRMRTMTESHGLSGRILARCVSDNPKDMLWGLTGAVAGVVRAQVLRRQWR
jgi:hypothetical protein